MKIAVIGYSGSGKSTLAQELSKIYGAETLHFDSIQFLPNWEVRPYDEKAKITEDFLDTHESWVIDGNYSKLFYERRMKEADAIIFLLFNRFSCFFRAFRRYLKYKNKTRPDMAEGCNEKFDFAFAKWILFEGRTKNAQKRYKGVFSQYSEKSIIIKNQRQLDEFMRRVSNSPGALLIKCH